MAYLNWLKSDVQLAFSAEKTSILPHSSRTPGTGAELRLTLSAADLETLTQRLEAVYVENGGELRVALSPDWVMFWNQRDEGGRVLLAHPEPNKWVSTVSLEPSQGKALIGALRNFEGSLRIEDHLNLHPVTNLSLQLEKK